MPSIRAPVSKKATTLTVAVKCRPLTEKDRPRSIVRVSNDKEVHVLDPDLSKNYLDRIQNRTKERKYSFDYAFGPGSTNLDVYQRSIAPTISGVVQGLNATVFAYGSTGSGKTYTMVGTRDDPGLMVLSLHTVFDFLKKDNSCDDFQVSCSYLEVYNEVIYDLLEKSSSHLELREDPVQGIVVAGLRCIKVQSADKILELLNLGNSRRKTESTEANATSSRSHAVLEITVTRKQRNKYRNQVIRGKLALVDLAGSERASETNNGGQKLRDGANINRSLLALANCINALGKQQKKGLAYVPYRNSKLTRILKDGLSGNSRTVMVATVSPAADQYHHTVNTLKYADRAKEIKTHIQKNIGTVDTHVSDYQRMIDSLQIEVCRLKNELAEKESQLCANAAEKASNDELSWLNTLSQETSENVQERINLQKAVFELEESNLRNRTELQHLDDAIATQQDIEKDGTVLQALRVRRQVILDNIRDNDEVGVRYQKEIEENEKRRCELQDMIEEAITNNGNKTYLRILSQYRILGMGNTELQFEIAMRDQIIYTQREAHRNLWNLLMALGVDERQILDLAAKQGIIVDGWGAIPNPEFTNRRQPLNPGYQRFTPSQYCPCLAESVMFQNNQDFNSNQQSGEQWGTSHSFGRAQQQSPRYPPSHDHSAYLRPRSYSDHFSVGNGSFSVHSPDEALQYRNSLPQMQFQSSAYGEGRSSASSFSAEFARQQEAHNNVTRQHQLMGHHVGLSSSEGSFNGTMLNRVGSAGSGFEYSPLAQISVMSSSNYSPNTRRNL